jgi:antitoxin (DNA-binding transcriptional repressor) of toxin-antitoxin stability system
MKKMSVSKFKAECLSILDKLDPEGLDITKHGKVVARVVPVEQQPVALIGSMKKLIKKKGNIMSTGLKWDAES